MPYSWPLQPFDRPHPVRANFNDPRITGASRAFQFGIDISAPNGTPVYAVAGGTVHLEDARAISVAASDAEFGYWHAWVRKWHTPVDFTKGLLPQDRFAAIYAPGTRQHHAGEPGRYRFVLAQTWTTQRLPDASYVLEVEASDLGGNADLHRQEFTLANAL